MSGAQGENAMDDKKPLSAIFGPTITHLKPNVNWLAWSVEQSGLKKKVLEHWGQLLDKSLPSPAYVTYDGVEPDMVTFDEISKGWENMPKKKTVVGKWMPVKKNGKLLADGMVVRRGDSDVPDDATLDSDVPDDSTLDAHGLVSNLASELNKTPKENVSNSFQYFKYAEYEPFGVLKAQGKAPGPVETLGKVKQAYENILASAKSAHIHPHEFAVAIKPLSNAAKGVVPSSVVKALESATVSSYSKYYCSYSKYYLGLAPAITEVNEEEVK